MTGPGLVDREAERAALDEMIAAVQAGESRVLVFRGAAGIGKSALLQYAEGAATGFRPLRAVGIESDMELAFAALHQFCLPLLDRMKDLPPPRRAALELVFRLRDGTRPDPFLVGLAVLDLLSGASEDQPVLGVIDDAQWLDRASAQVLGFVARRLLAESIALVVAARLPGPELNGRLLQPRDRRAPLPLPAHRRMAPPQDLREAGRRLPPAAPRRPAGLAGRTFRSAGSVRRRVWPCRPA